MRIKIENVDGQDDQALLTVRGKGAAKWARQQQSVLGSRWEADGHNFAYAIVTDSPSTIEALRQEGYKDVDDSEYSPYESARNGRRTAVAILGDVDFIEHDGAVVYSDCTIDVIQADDNDRGGVSVYRFDLEPYDGTQWWSKNLSYAAQVTGTSVAKLKEELSSSDVKKRGAAYYYAISAVSGPAEFDQEPLRLTKGAANKRYRHLFNREMRDGKLVAKKRY